MFDVVCPRHHALVTLPARDVLLVNTEEGPVVLWHCGCGYLGLYHAHDDRHEALDLAEIKAAAT
jgi:hypothetical protein